MENFNERKLKLLEGIGKLTKAINDEVDWFIASFQEKDSQKKALARFMSDKKGEELVRLIKEVCERYE